MISYFRLVVNNDDEEALKQSSTIYAGIGKVTQENC